MVRDLKGATFIEQTALRYSDFFRGPSLMIGRLLFDDVYDLLAVDHDAEHDVLAVQARRRSGRYKELTSVCIGSCATTRNQLIDRSIHVTTPRRGV